MEGETPLWVPATDQIRGSNLTRFAALATARYGAPPMLGAPAENYRRLWSWSTERPQDFWPAVWEFAGVLGECGNGPALRTGARLQDASWFDGARLNYAENLLVAPDEAVAICFANETGRRVRYTYGELKTRVARVAAGLASAGIGAGDVVAGYVPNIPEAVIAMLATTSLGAVWTSTSPDFGLEGVLDRFGQVSPKVLFTADGYVYAGKRQSCLPVVEALVVQVPSIVRTVVLPYLDPAPSLEDLPNAVLLADFEITGTPLQFHRVPFAAPLFVMYSSGTTGRPKCIVHGVGGSLLQHRKEHLLHADLRPEDRLFFYTTCGWMMWNWLASALATGSAIVLYDGSPMHPGPEVLWHLADEFGITHFGTSPRYLAALEKAGYRPGDHHRLDSLRSVLSTGSPLSPAQFDYVYRHIKRNQMLASISGGTDILSCFCLGVPWLPVHRGQIQGPGLGMAVEIWDDAGRRIYGQAGELVCTRPFPSLPVGFWNDAEGARYQATYFERFPGVWHHGDRVVETPEFGYVFLGRSDAVLNPGGVRIGTAEIYRQLEKLDEVLEALAVGQTCTDSSGAADERIVLFLRLREGISLDDALQARVRRVIRDNTTPRHVPARIVAVPELPRTRSGKIVEIAVKRVVHGLPVDNLDALENPAALDHFRNLPQLQN
jgi:acetoacetyl-CoA synthetase